MAFSLHYYWKILLSLLLIIFFFSHPATSQTQDLINKICHQTKDYGFCNTTFQKNLPSPSTDIYGLGKITIDQVLNTANNIRSLVEKASASNPALKDAFSPCLRAYETLIHVYQDASKSFDQKDYLSVIVLQQDTPRVLDSCIPPSSPSIPLVDQNKQMKKHLAMALVTGEMLLSH